MAVTDLAGLVRPFPDAAIQTNPSGGGSYVAHPVVEQRLLTVLGYPPDTRCVQIIRGHVAAIEPNPNGKSRRAKNGAPALTDAVVAVVLEMRCTIDGQPVIVQEVGDCEQPHNWDTDGARLKDAMSDAYKRCAMRLGVGLHLWAQDAFYLGAKMLKQDRGEE